MERTNDAVRKAAKRSADRDLRISRIKEPSRRRDCLADIYTFLPTYFPDVFYQPFTADRREMLDAILHAARYGGDQSVAGPRADGKTRSALFGTLALVLAGFVTFPMIISKSGPRASRELKNLKDAIESTRGQAFAEDFPEVVEPIIALGRWSSRARQQTVYGTLTNMEWGEECIILPSIPSELLWKNDWNEDFQSSATGQIVASLGIEGAIRGYCVRNRRPDLALLDDIDDRESAGSETQTESRERIIEEDVGGLAGPDKTISRVMLCTLINLTCNAAIFTDRTKKPSWRGQRHRLIEKFSDRDDLCDEYIQLRQNRAGDDPDARVAHQFYIQHQAEIEATAVPTNPYRFDKRLLMDGTAKEVSALQSALNIIADRGLEHFNTEYQNDPPQKAGPIESGITSHRIQKQVNGYERKIVPPGCTVITQGIDCGKDVLHWVVRAWRPDGLAYHTIDYGVEETHGTSVGSDAGLDNAIRRAIISRMEAVREEGYVRSDDGEVMPVHFTLVDARYRQYAVYTACRDLGVGIMPAMGHGRSAGCVRANFSPVTTQTETRIPGDGWFMQLQEKTEMIGRDIWLVNMDADRWKAWEHDRWMTDPGKRGCMYLFGAPTTDKKVPFSPDEKAHFRYSKHITAEIEVEKIVREVAVRKWEARSDNNHYLDASYMASVAANIKGIRLMRAVADSTPKSPAKKVPMPLEHKDLGQSFLASQR